MSGPGESLLALGVAALARAFACGDASPRQACELYLERIARWDGAIGAFVAIDADRARRDADASARRWARREARSALDGVPFAIKANIAVRGLPWTAGLLAREVQIATDDAACVERLRAAGAVILGTLNMDAGALGATTDNPWYGRTHNPYDLRRSAGGSSGGAGAAVAARLCAAALGTDTMGSVRIPAAACGVFAIVPPADAIDRRGIVPLAPAFDRVGILARSLDDLDAVLGVLADAPPSVPLADLPIAAMSLDERIAVDAAVREGYRRLPTDIAAAGLRSVVVDFDGYDANRAVHRLLLLVEAEGSEVHRRMLAERPQDLGATLGAMLRYGAGLSAERRGEAARGLAASGTIIRDALVGHAALASPTMPHLAAEFDDEIRKDTACFTAMASITGLPAIVLPFAGVDGGMPRSLQLIAPTTGQALCLARRLLPRLAAVPSPDERLWIAPPSLG